MSQCVRCGKKYNVFTSINQGWLKGHCGICTALKFEERDSRIAEDSRHLIDLYKNAPEKSLLVTLMNKEANITDENPSQLLIYYKILGSARKRVFLYRMSISIITFVICGGLTIANYYQPYNKVGVIKDIVFGAPIGFLMQFIAPILVMASFCFGIHTLVKYLRPLTAASSAENTVRQYLDSVLANLFPNFPAAYVCLLTSSKHEFGNYEGFIEYWKITKMVISNVILEMLGVQGNIHVFRILGFTKLLDTGDQVQFTVKMEDSVRLQYHTGSGVVTKDIAKYEFPILVDLRHVAGRWYLSSGKVRFETQQ